MKMNWKVQEHKMTLQKHGDELKCSRAQDDSPKAWKWTKEFKSIISQNLAKYKSKKTLWEGKAWVAKNFKTFKLGIWKTFGNWRGNHLLTCCGFGEQHAKHLLFSTCNVP